MRRRRRRRPTRLATSTGLVNWYSITFDPEGFFNGTPAMFVSSVDRSDPNKNIIFEIAPNGTLMGVFVQMTDGLSALKFNINPTAILVPPVQDQSFLSGLIAGAGSARRRVPSPRSTSTRAVIRPGRSSVTATLPTGVPTDLGLPVTTSVLNANGTPTTAIVNTGPIVGLTASNSDYDNEIFSIFTDFGTPAAGGIPARPGFSGVQGSDGELLDRPRRDAADRVAPRRDNRRPCRSRLHGIPTLRKHRLRPVRLLLAEPGPDISGVIEHDRRVGHHLHRRPMRRRTTAAACSSATWHPACS